MNARPIKILIAAIRENIEEFSMHDALMTQQALIAYTLGLIGLIMIKVLAPGFYARQNIKTPVKVAIFTLVITQLMNLVFVWKLQHAGLALAIGLGACVNAGLLYVLLRVKGLYQPKAGWRRFITKLLIALVVMAGGLWAAQTYLPFDWLAGGLRKSMQLLGLVCLGGLLYFSTLFALGFRPHHFKRSEVH